MHTVKHDHKKGRFKPGFVKDAKTRGDQTREEEGERSSSARE